MLESAVELLGGLFFGALVLLIVFCAVGSMVAALRAVSRAANGTEGFPRTLLARQGRVGHQMNPARKA
jgi:hypothetical protein